MLEIELFALPDETLTDISLVEFPATEHTFLQFNKDDKKPLLFADNEKHIITGAALVPDKRIYRNDENGEYFVWFSRDTIRKISEQFFNDYKNKAFTLEHGDNTNSVVVVESWIKDSETDKSVALGLSAPVGTWFISAKVNSPEIWRAIKEGVYTGFSVAGTFGTGIIAEAENYLASLQ